MSRKSKRVKTTGRDTDELEVKQKELNTGELNL